MLTTIAQPARTSTIRRFPLHRSVPVPVSDRLLTLERRLDEGYARIEEALARGEDVSSWEDFWIELLHEYESIASELPEAA